MSWVVKCALRSLGRTVGLHPCRDLLSRTLVGSSVLTSKPFLPGGLKSSFIRPIQGNSRLTGCFLGDEGFEAERSGGGGVLAWIGPLKDWDRGSYSHFLDHERSTQTLRFKQFYFTKALDVQFSEPFSGSCVAIKCAQTVR